MYFGSNSIMVQSYRCDELAASSVAKTGATVLHGTGVRALHQLRIDKANSCKRFNQRKNIDVPDSGSADDTNHAF
jgi:hypothetical protein